MRLDAIRVRDFDAARSGKALAANRSTAAGRLAYRESEPIEGSTDLDVDGTHLYTSCMLDPTARDALGEDATIPKPEATPWADGNDPDVLPDAIRRAFPALDDTLEIRPLQGGLLHQSFHLRAGDLEYVLQRVNDVFASEIHANIQAVTAHLIRHGMRAASLLPTAHGEFCAELGPLGRWRLMPHLGGVSFESLQSPAQAHSAGALVGRFHAALGDFDIPLAPLGIPYRDTPRYLKAMLGALHTHREHRLAANMRALARRILSTFEDWGPPPDVPDRPIHGDLKLSNLLFESQDPPGRDIAFALIDLDTLMRGSLWMELGDAWRSWCNPAIDPARENRFDLALFEVSARGFLEGFDARLSTADLDSLAMGPERITLELCARFVTDAVEETYFAWDDQLFTSRGDHNAARATAQWTLYESMRETRSEREAILSRLAR